MRAASAWRLLLLGLLSSVALAQAPPNLSVPGWQQRLDAALPLQLSFRDESAQVTPLAHYFGRRPVALVLMYLSCSQLCPVTLSSMEQAFQQSGLVPGRDVDLLAVSIDPWDVPARAAQRKAQLALNADWQRGLHILTAAPGRNANAAARLAQVVGLRYLYDPTSSQYAHPAGWVLIDPSGHINRYFFGVQYSPATVRDAVRSASVGAAPTWSTPLRLLCYCLTATAGRYDGLVLEILRIACIALLGLGAWWLWRTARRPLPAP